MCLGRPVGVSGAAAIGYEVSCVPVSSMTGWRAVRAAHCIAVFAYTARHFPHVGDTYGDSQSHCTTLSEVCKILNSTCTLGHTKVQVKCSRKFVSFRSTKSEDECALHSSKVGVESGNTQYASGRVGPLDNKKTVVKKKVTLEKGGCAAHVKSAAHARLCKQIQNKSVYTVQGSTRRGKNTRCVRASKCGKGGTCGYRRNKITRYKRG